MSCLVPNHKQNLQTPHVQELFVCAFPDHPCTRSGSILSNKQKDLELKKQLSQSRSMEGYLLR